MKRKIIKFLIILLAAFVLFELITGGGLLVVRTALMKGTHKEMLKGMDADIYVNYSAGFPQNKYYIPLIAFVSSWTEPGGIVVSIGPNKQANDVQNDFFNDIKAIHVIETIFIDDLGNRSVIHPVQFEATGGSTAHNWLDKSFEFEGLFYSDRAYEMTVQGQAIYIDGSEKEFVFKGNFSFVKRIYFGMSWLIWLQIGA